MNTLPKCNTYIRTLFNSPLFRTTRVSRYRKGKTVWILLKQETVSGSGIIWTICKSAPSSRLITMPAPRHSVFYRPDACKDCVVYRTWLGWCVDMNSAAIAGASILLWRSWMKAWGRSVHCFFCYRFSFFCPCDAVLAPVLAMALCLSVTSWCSIKTDE